VVGDKMTGTKRVAKGTQYIVFDEDDRAPPGFGLYVGKLRKTFIVQVRVGKKVTRVTIGDYPRINVNTGNAYTDARLLASELRRSLKSGEDIQQMRQEEREVIATTLGDVLQNYLRQYKLGSDPRENSIKAIQAAIGRLDKWLDRSLRSIGSKVVEDIYLDIAVAQGHVTAAEQTLMWCRAAFNVHIEQQQANRNRASFDGELLVNPFAYARRFLRTRQQLEAAYADNNARNPVENLPGRLGVWLNAVWEKRASNRDAADYLLLTLLVGARKSETAKLAWRERVLEAGLREADFSVITLDDAGEFGNVTFRETKSGQTHTIPIGRFATWLMMQRREDRPNGVYVFPSSSKNPNTKSPHYNSPREFVASLRTYLEDASRERAWQSLLTSQSRSAPKRGKSEFEGDSVLRADFDQRYQPQWRFTMHDLRRTFCTVAVNVEGMPYAVVQQLMNHGQLGNVTSRYGKPTQDALRTYMQKLEDELLKYGTMLPIPTTTTK
jgi:integrase